MSPPAVAPFRATPSLPDAAVFVLGVGLLYFFGGALLRVLLGDAALFAAEWILLVPPVALLLAVGRYDPVQTLSLRRPPRGALAAGALIILGAIPFIGLLGWLQSFVLPVPEGLVERMEELITADSAGGLLWLLLTLAATPAVCEELLFRGVLLSASGGLAPRRIFVLNGLVFGAFHLSFETVVRFLPTASLGMLIAWAVWRAGSIWVGVLMHFINNAVIVFVISLPSDPRLEPGVEGPPGLWLLAPAAFAVWAGVHGLTGATPRVPLVSSESETDP